MPPIKNNLENVWQKKSSFTPLFGYLGPSGFEFFLIIMLGKFWQSLVQIGLNWTYFKRFFMIFIIFMIFMIFRKCRKLVFSLICHFLTSGPFSSKKLRKLGARHGVEIQIGAIFNFWFQPFFLLFLAPKKHFVLFQKRKGNSLKSMFFNDFWIIVIMFHYF